MALGRLLGWPCLPSGALLGGTLLGSLAPPSAPPLGPQIPWPCRSPALRSPGPRSVHLLSLIHI
eukprot:3884987-Heterocapsa_arctica.AAC.1